MMIRPRQFALSLLYACLSVAVLVPATGCTVKPGEYGNIGFGSEAEDDNPLSESVREALEGRADIDTARINVSSDGDVVTLSGQVESTIERDSAEQVAQRVPGVRMVLNNVFAIRN